MWGQSGGHSDLRLKGKDTLSSKIGKEGSWKYRNTKVEGLKLTQMTLSSTKKSKKQQQLQNATTGPGMEGLVSLC